MGDIIMKRISLLSLIVFMLLPMGMVAQRYDYDDIYFNPKKDIKRKTTVKVSGTAEEDRDIEVVVTEYEAGEDDMESDDSSMSYTQRIKAFHRTDSSSSDDRLSHIDSPEYTTNVFVLSDGQYVVDVDGSNIEIRQNNSYPFVDWNYSYGAGWAYGFASAWMWSWYDPWYYNYYWYDPWYWNPWHCGYHYGCHHHHHHHYGHYYDYYYRPYHRPNYNHGGHHGWDRYYAQSRKENSRRYLNSKSQVVSSVASAQARPSSVRSTSSRSTSTARIPSSGNVSGNSTSPRGNRMSTSTSREVRNNKPLPARPTTVNGNRYNGTSSVRQQPSSTRQSVGNSSSTSVRPSSSSTRQPVDNNRGAYARPSSSTRSTVNGRSVSTERKSTYNSTPRTSSSTRTSRSSSVGRSSYSSGSGRVSSGSGFSGGGRSGGSSTSRRR